MQCPTNEQILKAAKTSIDAKNTLKVLFPNLFTRQIRKGELYEWSTDASGGSGLVVDNEDSFSFVNFRTGDVYLSNISKNTNIEDLNCMLARLSNRRLHDCYQGVIRGPLHFKSWSTKR